MESLANIVGVIGIAAFLGVMLCVGVTLGAYWRSLAAEDFLQWFARNNGYVARSVPVTVAPALAGLVTSSVLDWGSADGWLWFASTACLIIVIGLTGGFFVPANNAFATGQVAVEDVPARLRRWLTIHTIRIGVALTGAALACLAMQA